MNKKNLAKSLTFEAIKSETSVLTLRFIALLSIAIFAPMFGSQALTGTIVNAILFISVYLVGLRGAVLIGTIPSSVSVSTGLLSVVIAPMVPFIVFSNALLVYIFSLLKKKNYWKGVVFAGFTKFAFLYFVSNFVIAMFVSEKIADKIFLMMSWPQLFTALSGGILAYFFLKTIGKLER